MMTMVDLKTVADELRAKSRHCQTANGAAMLQAVAAWMEGRDIFDPPAELWEHADRLCNSEPKVSTNDGRGVEFITAKLEDLAVVYDFHMPPKETIAATAYIFPDSADPTYHRLDPPSEG